MGRIAVTGSVAWDTIMVFQDRFSKHVLPEKTHMLNVSFAIDQIQERRGGTGANVAYNLGLLGENPILCAAVGPDFASYGEGLQRLGVDLSGVLTCQDFGTSHAYITTDLDDNQIAAFYNGAMLRQHEIDLSQLEGVDWFVLSPCLPDAMSKFIDQCRALEMNLIFAPGQMIPKMDDAVLRKGLKNAAVIVGNDYEHSLMEKRSGISPDEMAQRGALVAITKGGKGSLLKRGKDTCEIPVAKIEALVDPTGAGDAYLSGLVHGLRSGFELEVAGRVGALAAAYAVEKMGPQEHFYTEEAFAMRFQQSFGMALPKTPRRELK